MDPNCEYYKIDYADSDNIICMKCKDYYTGKVDAVKGWVYDCQRDLSFEEVKYYNLDFKFQSMLSGFKCKNPSQIPILVYQTNADANANDIKHCTVNYDALSDKTLSLDSSITSKSIFCYNP